MSLGAKYTIHWARLLKTDRLGSVLLPAVRRDSTLQVAQSEEGVCDKSEPQRTWSSEKWMHLDKLANQILLCSMAPSCCANDIKSCLWFIGPLARNLSNYSSSHVMLGSFSSA